ncbi:MAG TPA: 5,6-dimethylbenzimidazole synthase [Acidimicrobiales bacterium]|nr:5,6-dimethylbenzimidazole synthase [Acidimicrobiales bacterium]
MAARPTWPRPVPTVGDVTSALERASDPHGWALPQTDVDALARVVGARRDVRRFRSDPLDPAVVRRVLAAGHAAPSVGHSQPWRFVVVSDAGARARAAVLADEQRLAQAAAMAEADGRHLLDLDLEGIREAPVGVVVCCDRRAAPAAVLGRATFTDADLWSCACAIENMWLTARAEGLGMGWVTLFRPDDLRALVGAPPGVETLGWLCLGWPDERPPAPGLERRGWSRRLPLEAVVFDGGWPGDDATPPSARPLRAAAGAPPLPDVAPLEGAAMVTARDGADALLTPPGSLGLLDRAVDRAVALGLGGAVGGTLVLAAADHPVVAHGVSTFPPAVTRTVVEAAVAGEALGVAAAAAAGLAVVVVDAGVGGGPVAGAVPMRPAGPVGDLVGADALTADDCAALVAGGAALGARLAPAGPVALGEVGVGNTTVAAAVAAIVLGIDPGAAVGLGAGADRATLEAKRAVVAAATARLAGDPAARPVEPTGLGPDEALAVLAGAGGGEVAVLTGVVIGVAAAGGLVVLDGLVTSVAALLATRIRPGVASHLVAGQRSRESAAGPVLAALGLEPLLDLRIRAGEGAGASLATGLVLSALAVRSRTARTR